MLVLEPLLEHFSPIVRLPAEGEVVDVGDMQALLPGVDERPVRREALADLSGRSNVGHDAGEGFNLDGMIVGLSAGCRCGEDEQDSCCGDKRAFHPRPYIPEPGLAS